MLVTHVLLQILLDLLRTRAQGVACIQYFDHHIARVQHFVQLAVDSLALPGCQENVPNFTLHIRQIPRIEHVPFTTLVRTESALE